MRYSRFAVSTALWCTMLTLGSACVGTLVDGTVSESERTMSSSATFVKHGNNGTVSCDQFCANTLADWGPLGSCCGATLNGTAVGCEHVPGLTGAELTCTCAADAFVKHGNNGTVSCDQFCQNTLAYWGEAGTCLAAKDSATGQALSCQDTPGLLAAGELTCTCLRPGGACAAADPAQTNPYTPDGCLKWNGQISLQDALNANACVLVLPGTYELGEALHVAAGKKLTGEAGQRSSTILRASATFDTTDVPLGRSSLVLNSTTGKTTISHLTLDGRRRAVRIICCSHYTLDDVAVVNATCDGVDISGPEVVVQNSEIAFNASNGSGGGMCQSAAAPYGGGIYCQGYPAAIAVNAQILNNTIHDNYGMGIDVNGCHYGTISGNNVYSNNGPAAIGLYGASHWTLSGNAVAHPHNATYNPVFHPYCNGGPIGSGSAALYICQDTDANGMYSTENTVTNNHFSGKYGILSIGADELQKYWAPRKSVFQSNVLTGSIFGCADDFAPGQWFSDDNIWSGNNCGTPSGAPVYF